MSNAKVVMPKGYGTPLAWLFYDSGKVLRMLDDKPLSSYLQDFTYVYDEDNDDTCDIKLNIPSLEVLNLPYLKQDVKLKVQWGYITGTGEFLKTDQIKIAIRDIVVDYLDKGIFITLKCTDLVSYIKNQKTQTFRRYKNKDGEKFIVHAKKQRAYFVEWLREIANGEYIVSITIKASTLRLGKDNSMTLSKFNPSTMERISSSKINDVNDLPDMFAQELWVARGIKGAGKAIPNAMEDKMKFFNVEGEISGHYLQNTTGESLHIHKRNFNQEALASYTYYGGTGELISFNSKTNTTKIKHDKAKTTGVNPYNKNIETQEVSTAITDQHDKEWEAKVRDKRLSGNTVINGKEVLTKEILKWLKETEKTFNRNIVQGLNQVEIDNLTYSEIIKNPEVRSITNSASIQVGVGPIDTSLDPGISEIKTIAAVDILNSPEFQDLLTEGLSSADAKLQKEMVLLGYLVEKIQRKYEASCKIIGDPSLIKSKVYNFLNLSHLDSGKWYATKVTHKITKKGGYFTTMDLIKVPPPVVIAKNTSKEKINGEIETISDTTTIWKKKQDDRIHRLIKGLSTDEIFEHYPELLNGTLLLDKYDTLVDKLNTRNTDSTLLEGIRERIRRVNSEEDLINGDENINNTKKRGTDTIDNTNADNF